MNYPLRSIAFITEMIHQPMAHKGEDLQKLHSMAFTDQNCKYQNFQMLPVGAQMSNPPRGVQSISACTFLNDRVQIREELTGISCEDFESRIKRVAQLAIDNLNIQSFMVQQYVIRTLINPRMFSDSKEFMSSALLGLESDNFSLLGRNREILGIRFALSPPEENEGVFNLRVESYSNDIRSLFIENIGSYRTLVKTSNIDDLLSNFSTTYSYIEDNVVPFLAQFDTDQ